MTEEKRIEQAAPLFGFEKEIIRTLGFYQPFCSLMRHGKIETRWVREGKKPPFPLGKYLLYSTKEPCTDEQLDHWCGSSLYCNLTEALANDTTKELNGYAIAIGQLVNLRHMTRWDDEEAFVRFVGTAARQDKNGKWHKYIQWCLEFENVQAIEPFPFAFGKQGVGILPESEHSKIKILTPTP